MSIIVSSENPWVRIASSVPVVNGLLKVNCVLADSTLEAMRTQGFSEEMKNHAK